MRKTIVNYHGGGCHDGLLSRIILENAMSPRAKEIEYRPRNFHEHPLEGLRDAFNVYYLDFSPQSDEEIAICESRGFMRAVRILDHHASARTPSNYIGEVDKSGNSSGASLTWEYFYGPTVPVPLVVKLVRDRDLWKDNPDAHALHAMLSLESEEHKAKLLKACLFDDKVTDSLVTEGRNIKVVIEKLAQQTAKKCNLSIELWTPDPTMCVNQNFPLVFLSNMTMASEVGHALVKLHGVGACAIPLDGENVQISLRGDNVLEYVKIYGGGGHPNACGFTEEWTWLARQLENFPK